MLDAQLNKLGTILIHDGKIYFEGFDADNCMCREVAIHAMIWAIGKLQKEIIATLAAGNQGSSCADLPDGVGKVLGLPEPFTNIDDPITGDLK